jgi:hypothetical protein
MFYLYLFKLTLGFALLTDFALTFLLLSLFGVSTGLAAAIALVSTCISTGIIFTKLKKDNGGQNE